MKKEMTLLIILLVTTLLAGCINVQKIKKNQNANIEATYAGTKGTFVWEKNTRDFDAFINLKMPDIKKINGLFWMPPEKSYYSQTEKGFKIIKGKCNNYKYITKNGHLVKGYFRLPTNSELSDLNKYFKINSSADFPPGYYHRLFGSRVLRTTKVDPDGIGGFTREDEYYSCVCDSDFEKNFSIFDIMSLDIDGQSNLSPSDKISVLQNSFIFKYGSPVIENTDYDKTTGRMTINIASTKKNNLLKNSLKQPADQSYRSKSVFRVVGIYNFNNETLIHLKFRNKVGHSRNKTSVTDLLKNHKTKYVFIGNKRQRPGAKIRWEAFEGKDFFIGTDRLPPKSHNLHIKFDFPNRNTELRIKINDTINTDYSDGVEYLTAKKPAFRTTLVVPIAGKYAASLQKKMRRSSFSPKVLFNVNANSFEATKIEQLDNYKYLAEKYAFDMAYSSINKLNTFIERFSDSTLIDKAKLRVIALSGNSISKLKSYMKKYPGDKYNPRAKKRIKVLVETQRRKKAEQDELNKDNAYGDLIGSPNLLNNAKFINGRIWQDVPLNSKIKHMTYYEAKEYAANLSLLGIKGWRLPSKEDFLRLGKDMNRLEYAASQKRFFTWFFTRDVGCESRGLFSISKQNCVTTADISTNSTPYISKSNKNTRASVKCVLSTYKYNKKMRAVAQEAVKKNNFHGYLDAFMAVGDKKYIKQAYSLAKNQNQKKAIEFALIKYFGFNNVFNITGELNGNENDGSKQSDFNKLLITAVTSSGKAYLDYDLKVKKDGKVPLKYGRYALTIKFELNLKYSISAMGMGTSEREKIERVITINLTPEKGWAASGRIDFGQVIQAQKGNVIIFNVSKSLTEVKPIITIQKIEAL